MTSHPLLQGSEPDGVPGWAAPVPDDVELVSEAARMMAVYAAERFERIESLTANARANPQRYGGGTTEIIERSVRLELAAVLGITENAAGTLVAQAESLVHRYPDALAALGGARITERHAVLLVELLDASSAGVRDRLTARAVELAEELPVGSFRRALRRLVETEESETLTDRHAAAVVGRRVIVEPAADGMAWLHTLQPAVEAHAIYDRLTRMGKALTAHPDETRTLDQVRADILGDLLIDGDTTTLAPEARGIRATVTVTVPALALLATDDTERHAAGLAPATVEGIGPIPLGTAKELCGTDPSWMRVLTHPETGIVLSVGRTRYRPPPALRKLITWRAERCMAPGCHIPASRCEIDHNIAWEHGGHTALDNHAPLCTGHHTVKHHGGWSIEHLPDQGGALLWTSPTGRHYLVKPERSTVAFRPTQADGHADAPF